MNRKILMATIASLSIFFGTTASKIVAQESHEVHPTETVQVDQFQRIEQPLGHKIAVILVGLGLISLELWWFLISKPKSQQAVATSDNIQEVAIAVDGGYEPSRIVVQVGKPVRLKFTRTDPSRCLEQVIIADFHIAADLPLHQVTTVEFTPEKIGEYAFSCGMNMFRGAIAVEANT